MSEDVILGNNVSEEQIVTEGTNIKENSKNFSYKPSFTIREMLEAGVHFGHKTSRWNAKMSPYIYGVKNELHIIDLTQSAILLFEASKILKEIVKRHGKILFVCTKKQGSETVKAVAESVGQYYVTNKWLGGMLTNWKTVSRSIKTLNEIEVELADERSTLTKKEKLVLDRKRIKLQDNLGGIRNMTKIPDIIFVIDTPREALAIAEAKALGIPVMAIVDTNSDPDVVDYQIPGNDDSIKAISLYMNVIEGALKNALENLSFTDEEFKNKERSNKGRVQSKKPSKSFNNDKKEKLELDKKTKVSKDKDSSVKAK
jgi:small subunit ribosomal protein S2